MPGIDLIGKKLGDYTILSVLGQGGMAHVYKGYDAYLDRHAAVKVIQSGTLPTEDDVEYTERFLREAKAIARLNHPHIVSVYQFGETQETAAMPKLYYMAMAFLEGRDLRHVMKEYAKRDKLMSYGQVRRVIRDITEALDHAHQQGVIHRDVKPSNIMITNDGRAVLTDFGLALRTQEGTIGNTFGSVHYIAPEQAVSSAHAIPQSDLYALGVVLFEMLTGRVPFDDNSVMSVALKHISDPPPPPRTINPDIPQAVEDVVLRVLEKDPDKRYSSGAAFADALEAAFNMSDDDDTQDLVGSDLDPFAILTQNDDAPAIPLPAPAFREPTRTQPPTREVVAPPGIAEDESETISKSDSIKRPTLSKRIQELNAIAEDDRDRRWLVWGGGAVAAVLVIGLFVALLGGLGGGAPGDDITPTAPAVAAADQTQTALAALPLATDTPTPTTTPTAVHTDTPAPTATATNTATATPTPTPTATPTLVTTPQLNAQSDDEGLLLIRYDGTSLVVYNRSPSSNINLNNLVFVGESSSFSANDWPNNRRSVPPRVCYQLWTPLFVELPADEFPAEVCDSRRGFIQTARTFWISETPDATFEVRRSGMTLGVCPAVRAINREDNRCVVDIR